MTMTAEDRATRAWASGSSARQPTPLEVVLEEAGVSYRQLDYWVRRGYLRPEDALPGSGHSRAWSAHEIAVAREMKRLCDAGLSAELAARVAREFVDGESLIELAPGLTLDIEGDNAR